MSYCRSCRSPIVWAEHYRTGKNMPLEVAPEDVTRGVYVIDDHDRAVPVQEAGAVSAFDVRYVSHFSTCPEADKWRGGGS